MCVRRPSRKTTRVHGLCPRNRSKPRKGPSNRQDAKANQHQRSTPAHRKARSIGPLHQQIRRKDLTVLQIDEKGEKFKWTEEASNAFADLKKTLSTPPILAVPKEREKLYLYIKARSNIVSTVLVVERIEEGKIQSIQRPIYYLRTLLTKPQQ